ncbi:MAG: SMC-Scp complex subunit ScpB [Cellvibrionaceae bacterium]|nr:SMC-Scp complex subunit ScpB [Cellvibrionaceae bacterium]|tara:strand:+ start:12263 stop:13429 length:1167 start_codon:yes stop_codon:yes gene_type:complete
MSFDKQLLTQIIEGALLAAGHPLTIEKILSLFEDDEANPKPAKDEMLAILQDIQAQCEGRGFELVEVGSGWRFQVRKETAPWVNRMWDEKPQKYSRALLETLALIAYRQPITRGDIEEIRGVAVSSHIIKTLSEREWIKVVGHRDVPGRPSLYATTRQFLDYFNLKSLEELPSLGEIKDLEELNKELDLGGDIPDSVKQTLELPDEESESHNSDDATDGVESGEEEVMDAPADVAGETSTEDETAGAETEAEENVEPLELSDVSMQEPESDTSDNSVEDDEQPPIGESAFEEDGLDEHALAEAAVAIAVEEEQDEEPGPLDRLLSGEAPEAYGKQNNEEHNEEHEQDTDALDTEDEAEHSSEDDGEDTSSKSESNSLFAPSDAPSVFD